jgi:hypothetical protein
LIQNDRKRTELPEKVENQEAKIEFKLKEHKKLNENDLIALDKKRNEIVANAYEEVKLSSLVSERHKFNHKVNTSRDFNKKQAIEFKSQEPISPKSLNTFNQGYNVFHEEEKEEIGSDDTKIKDPFTPKDLNSEKNEFPVEVSNSPKALNNFSTSFKILIEDEKISKVSSEQINEEPKKSPKILSPKVISPRVVSKILKKDPSRKGIHQDLHRVIDSTHDEDLPDDLKIKLKHLSNNNNSLKKEIIKKEEIQENNQKILENNKKKFTQQLFEATEKKKNLENNLNQTKTFSEFFKLSEQDAELKNLERNSLKYEDFSKEDLNSELLELFEFQAEKILEENNQIKQKLIEINLL